jgi:hypothetical protein
MAEEMPPQVLLTATGFAAGMSADALLGVKRQKIGSLHPRPAILPAGDPFPPSVMSRMSRLLCRC